MAISGSLRCSIHRLSIRRINISFMIVAGAIEDPTPTEANGYNTVYNTICNTVYDTVYNTVYNTIYDTVYDTI